MRDRGCIALALKLEFRLIDAARHIGCQHQQQVDRFGGSRHRQMDRDRENKAAAADRMGRTNLAAPSSHSSCQHRWRWQLRRSLNSVRVYMSIFDKPHAGEHTIRSCGTSGATINGLKQVMDSYPSRCPAGAPQCSDRALEPVNGIATGTASRANIGTPRRGLTRSPPGCRSKPMSPGGVS